MIEYFLGMSLLCAFIGATIVGCLWADTRIRFSFEQRAMKARTLELATQAELARRANEETLGQIRRSMALLKGQKGATVVPLHPEPAA